MKPGDYVTFTEEATKSNWFKIWREIDGSMALKIHRVVSFKDIPEIFTMTRIDGSPIAWDAKRLGTPIVGFTRSYLQPAQFLTAVKNAIDDAKTEKTDPREQAS